MFPPFFLPPPCLLVQSSERRLDGDSSDWADCDYLDFWMNTVWISEICECYSFDDNINEQTGWVQVDPEWCIEATVRLHFFSSPFFLSSPPKKGRKGARR